MDSRPRWPGVDRGSGMYESYYLRAAHPDDPVAVWIRYTVQKPKGKTPKASLWFTLFDASLKRPLTEKLTVEHDQLSEPRNSWIKIADSTFGIDGIAGSSGDASWDLRLREAARPLLHLSPCGVKARIEIEAEKKITAAWNYGGRDGHLHDVLNCSMAELEVQFTVGSGKKHSLTTDHGGTYELGLPERQDWLGVEPYPDLW